jgi:hypothetical protein
VRARRERTRYARDVDLDTRRDFFHQLRTEVRREIRQLQEIERLLKAAAERSVYPSADTLGGLKRDLARARENRQNLVEEILQVVSAPPPSRWRRFLAWLRGR